MNTNDMIQAAINEARQTGGHLYTPAPVDGQVFTPAPVTPVTPVVVYQQAPIPPVAPAPAPVTVAAPPARDPWPARLVCGGVGLGAAGVGIGWMAQMIAAATTGLALLIGVLVLACLLKALMGRGHRGAVNVNVTTNNRNRNR